MSDFNAYGQQTQSSSAQLQNMGSTAATNSSSTAGGAGGRLMKGSTSAKQLHWNAASSSGQMLPVHRRVHQQSKLTEYKDFLRNMPRFQHKNLAVINPSTSMRNIRPNTSKANLELQPQKIRIGQRQKVEKDLPEHLIRAPQTQQTSRKSGAPISAAKQLMKSGKMDKMSMREKREALERAQQADLDLKRERRVQKAEKEIYKTWLTMLAPGRNDEVPFDAERVGTRFAVKDAQDALQMRKFVTSLYSAWKKTQLGPGLVQISTQVQKQDFIQFLRTFDQQMPDSELGEIFQHHVRQKQLKKQKLLQPSKSQASTGLGNSFKSSSNGRNARNLKGMNKDLDQAAVEVDQDSELAKLDQLMDLADWNMPFDQFYKSQSSMGDILNPKAVKAKSNEIRQKLDVWKKRDGERKRLKKRTNERSKQIRDKLKKMEEKFDHDMLNVGEVSGKYHELFDDLNKNRREETWFNDILAKVTTVQMIQPRDIERVMELTKRANDMTNQIVEKFAAQVRTDCIVQLKFFSLHQVPEMLVKNRTSKKDFEIIQKVLLKVKRLYLAHKALLFPGKALQNMVITEEDEVPLELIDQVLSELKHKQSSRLEVVKEFLDQAANEVQKQIKAQGAESENSKRTIENAVFISFLNLKLDTRHAALFKFQYIHEQVYRKFVRQNPDILKVSDLKNHFTNCLKVDEKASDYQANFTREIQKFTGKINVGDIDGSSEATSLTGGEGAQQRMRRQSTLDGGSSPGPRSQHSPNSIKSGQASAGDGYSPEIGGKSSLAQGLIRLGGEDAINEQLNKEDEEEDRRMEKAEQRRLNEEKPLRHLYVDKEGKEFDPERKFGVIEGESLIYDRITTSYPVNLPPDYYLKHIQKEQPKKEDGKWFIRPHHIESVTEHTQSMKDDVMNTRYYSHYNVEHGKKKEEDPRQQAIDQIEAQLENLRSQQIGMAAQKGKDYYEEIDRLKEQQRAQAQSHFEKIISNKNYTDSKKEIIGAYEGILLKQRRVEKDILNKERFKEFEKNRPPADKWFELKTPDFSKELYRNRVSNKPNNQNSVYLKRLQDPYIY